MLEGLQAILEKNPIVPTVNANDLINDPQSVEGDYIKHVKTYVPMGDVGDLAARLVKRTISGKTPKGLIVAPYGYGKTSTAAFLWNACEESGLLATPPFYCANLLDILKATYGWVKFRLEQREPGLVADLDDIYRKYTAVTVDEMAKRYSEEHGLATVTASNLLNEMLEEGSLNLELTPANLLFFLDATTTIVTRAGFTGLAILPDEFQQYFSKGANLRKIVQEFREFVWGLDTRSTALGVMFSMPTYAEAVVQDHGKDILHRLKNDGLYYRLQDIYTVEFPSRLWDRYIETFQLEDVASGVIESDSLRSIGQIAEREDLGEGPRTVIDSFKRAILHYQDQNAPYTPVDLVDDFLGSNINFQSQTNKLKTVTRQALDSAIIDSEEMARAVKLLAAFPRGCQVDVQRRHGLYDVVNQLSKQAHGELMTHLVEGYTLLGLSKTGGPTHTVDHVITRFWKGFEEDELHTEAAMRTFISGLLPRFFEQRRGTAATGWGNLDFSPTPHGSYTALIEGTFNPRFPKRLLFLQISKEAARLQSDAGDADLQFDFIFTNGAHQDAGDLHIKSDRHSQFYLNLRKKVGPALPEDLKKLQEFVNPEFVTPLLMLGLVDYFERWEEISERPIPQSDQAEVDYFVGRLIDHSIRLLFNEELASTTTPPLRRVGRLMLEELFNRLCSRLYPEYHTFFNHAQYDKVLNNYINGMKGLTLKQRRGHSTVEGTKESLARTFGLTSVATFENRIDNEYSHLMRKEQFTGRGDRSEAVIRLTLHPLEEAILETVKGEGTKQEIDGRTMTGVSSKEVAETGRSLGYRDEEIFLALKALAARGYTSFDKANKIVYLAQVGPEPEELELELEKFAADVEKAEAFLSADRISSLKSRLVELQQKLKDVGQNEEELDEIRTEISDLRQGLDNELAELRKELRKELSNLTLDIERTTVKLRHDPTLRENVEGQMAFVMHLNELRQSLEDEKRSLIDSSDELRVGLEHAAERTGAGPLTEVREIHEHLSTARVRYQKLDERRLLLDEKVDQLKHWIDLLRDSERLYNALGRLPDLRSRLTNEVVPEIQAHLTKRRLDGLSDWEPFHAKVRTVEEELEKRRRHGNELFAEAKENYEEFLRKIQVGDYRPRTRYTYGEDEESYKDLYEEVRLKIAGRIDQVAQMLERERTDVLKVEHITFVPPGKRSIVEQVHEELRAAEDALSDLRGALSVSLIKNAGDELEEYGTRLIKISDVANGARKQLGPILFADHEITEDERKVLEVLNKKTEVDLTDLFVEIHQQSQDGIKLSELLSQLENLYRKHRLTIRVRPRG